MRTFAFKKDLQQLLTQYAVGDYCNLTSWELAEQIVSFIDQTRKDNLQPRYHEWILSKNREADNEF